MQRAGAALAAALEESDVMLDLAAPDADAVLAALARRLAARAHGVDAEELARALRERESQGSTAVASGVALPHCRSPHLLSPRLAVARLRSGIEFGAVDGEPTRLFLAVAAPEGSPGEHLRILAELARHLRDPGATAALFGAESPAEVIACLGGEGDRERGPA